MATLTTTVSISKEEAILLAIQRYATEGNEKALRNLVKGMLDAEKAKQILRDKGYGWTGLNLCETVELVPNLAFNKLSDKSDTELPIKHLSGSKGL